MGIIAPNYNLIAVLEFRADPDVRIDMENSQIVFLPPVFRKIHRNGGDEFIDATGEYDLCMSTDGRFFHFYNRLPTTEIFAYRYFSIDYLLPKGIR
jgi:hypothetical protein